MPNLVTASDVPMAWMPRFLRMSVSSSILLVLTTLWTVARIYSRRLSKARYQVDDYVYFIAQFWFYCVCACAVSRESCPGPLYRRL
jgi:hypothetical protein